MNIKLFKEFNFMLFIIKKKELVIYICKKGFDLIMDI